MLKDKRNFQYLNYLVAILIVAGCGIVYQLLLSSAASYILGDSIKQFSLVIGIFMCALGLGAYISRLIENHLIEKFIFVEIILSLVGGYSVITIFFLYTHDIFYTFSIYIMTLVIGTLVGIEIPLMVRVLEGELPLKDNIAGVLSFDYVGSLIGSVSFPLILLPSLGLIRTAILISLLNLVAVLWLLIRIKQLRQNKASIIVVLLMTCVMVFSLVNGKSIEGYLEQAMYRDPIVFSKKTPYQDIVVTKWKNDVRLFINGSLQFSTVDEHRYHEALIHIPIGLHKGNIEKVLILGGGDGMALRELLKYDSIQTITLVDIDGEVTNLFKNNKVLAQINSHSFSSSKVKVINEDAFHYLKSNRELYDLIIADLPDPKNYMVSKLYTTLFYKEVKRSLDGEGIFVTQASSPFFTRKAFWCISKTVEQVFGTTYEYNTNIPSFGEWGFVLAGLDPVNIKDIQLKWGGTKYLNNKIAVGSFIFSADEHYDQTDLEVNTVLNPVLVKYYLEDLNSFN